MSCQSPVSYTHLDVYKRQPWKVCHPTLRFSVLLLPSELDTFIYFVVSSLAYEPTFWTSHSSSSEVPFKVFMFLTTSTTSTTYAPNICNVIVVSCLVNIFVLWVFSVVNVSRKFILVCLFSGCNWFYVYIFPNVHNSGLVSHMIFLIF